MKEYLPDYEYNMSREMFRDALVRLNKKNPDKYKFILKAGQSLTNSLFSLFQAVWTKEKIPSGWKKTEIVQLFKGKSKASDPNGYRNIHIKHEVRKCFGEIVTHEMKVIENIS